MVVSENLEQSRAALTMIQPDPFNAEASIEGVRAEITPTEFHYVRSNFRLPAHDGVLEIAGAVENPLREPALWTLLATSSPTSHLGTGSVMGITLSRWIT